jgi:hypothetical protein
VPTTAVAQAVEGLAIGQPGAEAGRERHTRTVQLTMISAARLAVSDSRRNAEMTPATAGTAEA